MNRKTAAAAALAAMALATAARAEIAVSANDGKQVAPGETPAARTTDGFSIIDLRAAPRVVAQLRAPASMIGPPTSVAVAPNESFAIATAAQSLSTLSPATLILDDTLTVIDLANPAAPRVVQTLKAGAGATGVAINRQGTMALVASTGDDSIRLYSIANKRLTEVGMVRLDYQCRPTDVAFAPDGKSAVAVGQTCGKLVRLSIDGKRLTRTGQELTVGIQPYGVTYTADGSLVLLTNLGGDPPRPGETASGPRLSTVAIVDMRTNTIASSVEVGPTSEHVVLSPDGRHAAVIIINGSNGAPTAPSYRPFGILKVYRLEGTKLTQVAEAQTGAWPQGGAWTRDGRAFLVQHAGAKEIGLYRFDGAALTRDASATVKLDARPGALGVGWQR